MELRIRHLPGYDGASSKVRITLTRDDQPTQVVVGNFGFALTAAEQGDLRWYLEEYMKYPKGEFANRAHRVETLLRIRGDEIFDRTFGDPARLAIYDSIESQLSQCRVVIETAQDDYSAIALPWEIMRDKRSGGDPVALNCQSFVRSQPDLPVSSIRTRSSDSFNILLIISRPDGTAELPFLESTRPLLDLAKAYDGRVRVDVLRPPTFTQFEELLRERPGFYHMVHFDGHGSYAPGVAHGVFNSAAREGYLIFENDRGEKQYVSGLDMRRALIDRGVTVVLLDACQTGMARVDVVSPSVGVRLLRAGVDGVVAMSYSVDFTTTVTLMGRLYSGLIHGESLGVAIQAARKHLASETERLSISGRTTLKDWMVPVIYEGQPVPPLTSFSVPPSARPKIEPSRHFFGRDRAFRLIERSIYPAKIIHLCGSAGLGKTSTIKEFLWWFRSTNQLHCDKHSAYLSLDFSQLTVESLIDAIGEQCRKSILELYAIKWDDLPKEWRRLDSDVAEIVEDLPSRFQVVLRYLNDIPCFIHLDDVDADIPMSDATKESWEKLLEVFLSTRVRIFMTTRHTKLQYSFPHRTIRLSELQSIEVYQLAESILNRPVPSSPETFQVLDEIGGNPLILETFLPELDRTSPERLADELRLGTIVVTDVSRAHALQSSLKSRLMSLSIDDRKRLAILGVFQKYVLPHTLERLAQMPDALPFLKDLSVDDWVQLLDNACRVGLVDQFEQNGPYRLSAALPWFFHDRLKLLQATSPDWLINAYIGLYATYGTFMESVLGKRIQTTLNLLSLEMPNLLHAFREARKRSRWNDAGSILDLIGQSYKGQGFWSDLTRLVKELRADVCDESGSAIPGREHAWSVVLFLEVDIAQNRRDYSQMDATNALLIDFFQQTGDQQNIARTLYRSAMILVEQRAYDLAEAKLKTCLRIREDIDDLRGIAQTRFELGNIALMRRRFVESDQWYHQSYVLFGKIGDMRGQANASHQLGIQAEEQLQSTVAERYYRQSLAVKVQTGDHPAQAETLFRLGALARKRRDWENAENALRESLTLLEQTENHAGQGMTLRELGVVARERKQWDEATRWYELSLEVAESFRDVPGRAATLLGMGILARERQDTSSAIDLIKQCLSLCRDLRDEHAQGEALYHLAMASEDSGEIDNAYQYSTEALTVLAHLETPQLKALAQELHGRLSSLPRSIKITPVTALPALSDDDDLLPLPPPRKS